jgi:hypothetical protein
VQQWTQQQEIDLEVLQHTMHFQIGPVTEEEYAKTPYGNLRKILHLSLFQQLATLILTKQQLEDIDLDLPLQLQHLDLSYNRFKHVPSRVVDMKQLRVLKLQGNVIQEIKSVRSLPIHSLVELHLQHNDGLQLLNLSGMSQLQYLNCQYAHPKLQVINFAGSQAREVFLDDRPHLRRTFVDEEDEPPARPEPISSSLLDSVEWVDRMQFFRLANPKQVTEIQQRSNDHIQRFLALFETAFLMEAVLPTQTKRSLSELTQWCAFLKWYPDFLAVNQAAAKKQQLLQFKAFVSFCESHECFLDWTVLLTNPTSYDEMEDYALRVFGASKFTLDLTALFPSPNQMHREVADLANNQALFDVQVLTRFSNHKAMERWWNQQEEKRAMEQLVSSRVMAMEQEIRELDKQHGAEERHFDLLVRYEQERRGAGGPC